MTLRTLLVVLAFFASAADNAPRMPMVSNYADSIQTRWLSKKVLSSKLLDEAESMDTWKLVNQGQARGDVTLTKDRAFSGAGSIRLRSSTIGDKPIPNGRYYGTASALRIVAGEDWSGWNRLSFRIYPDLPGFRVVSLVVIFHNEGSEAVPDVYGKMGLNYLILRNNEWNHVVWEIPNLPRDKVTGLEFAYRLQGNEPGATKTVTFDIDEIELQKVNADLFQGWNVAPGEIAFSHSGYQTGSPKSAIASDLDASEFRLINAETSATVLSKRVATVTSQIGRFQVMDSSEVRDPGVYILRAGTRSTRPFPIGDDIWKSSLWKAINFFYVERCGFAIPGVHDACHRDWQLIHGDRKLIINGGWHDAGDLSQSFTNTAEAAYAMFSLAEGMQSRNEDPVLLKSLIEEAKWGLAWLLKTTFHDGFRPSFSTMDRWTNGIIGDLDDMVAEAANSPSVNFAAAATEAIAARVLKSTDPTLASYSLKQAVEDWDFAVVGMATSEGSPRRVESPAELAGHAVIAGLELWQATGDSRYRDKSFELARTILDSQHRTFVPGLTHPLTGYFYTGPDKTRLLRYSHLSHEDAPVGALVRLCELFPDHADWIEWYSAVTLYSQYFQQAMSQFTEPYGMLANSVHKDDEYLRIPERSGGRGVSRDAYKEQVLNGVKVGDRHYVRLFPVWFEFRGNHGTVLTQASALSSAAHLRGDLGLASLAERQLQWVVGRNPFTQSTMWGEGYSYAPQYSAMSGDIVGSLPVGIQTHRNSDVPYWPAENCHNWKEVWVHPVARWFSLLRDLAGPALLSGTAPAGSFELRETRTGKLTRITPDRETGSFRVTTPAGEYEVTSSGRRLSMTLLPGRTYSVNLAASGYIDVRISQSTDASGVVTIRATVSGVGDHTLLLRTHNLTVDGPRRAVGLKSGAPQTVIWRGQAASIDAPWVAVVIPDNDQSQRREVTGSAIKLPQIHP